ncbi:MAG: helix-turn-helix domain-containing protein [Phycisphaeraceae bacterium]|nr:helix-turn-helix domain-containing protein [Phycisphaeraceae bacterium]
MPSDTTSPIPSPLSLRPKDAAKALGIGRRKLWELTKAGDIPHVKVGTATLYPTEALRAWLIEHARKGVRR